MEEMNRTHKEPAWGWLGVATRMIGDARQTRVRSELRVSPPKANRQVVTPWSPRSAPGWSA